MKQTRFIPIETCGLQVREPQEGQSESRHVEGKPIVFGVRSVNLTPWSSTRVVYEVLEPGCLSAELIQRSDVILNLNHNSSVTNVMGRCRNGQGTLEIALESDHVRCACDLPKTNAANDTLELIRRGDISGMSFAFSDDYEDTENGVSYERTNETVDGKEVWLRHVKRITKLYDVSIVTTPAYEQTSVATRESSDAIDAAIEEQLKREAEVPAASPAGEETDEEKAQREAAEKAAAERKAEEEREQKERERMAHYRRQRNRARLINQDIESIIY